MIWHSSRHPGKRFVPKKIKKAKGDLRITVRASPSGDPHPSSTPQPAGVPLDRTGTSAEWGTPCVSFSAPPDDRMSIATSEGRMCLIASVCFCAVENCWAKLALSGDDDSAALPASGVVALSEPDPEMMAMLSRAAENVGLMWNSSLRLDEWFLDGGRAGSQCPPPMLFSRKCTRSLQDRGRQLSLPETNLGAPPPSPPSMVEPLWGTRASPWWSGLWPCN